MRKCLSLIISCFLFLSAFGQHTLFGTVVDENGEPLPDVYVILQEMERETVTDADGFFMFSKLEDGNYTLILSFLGFETVEREVAVRGQTSIEIELAFDAFSLGEVVVSATRAAPGTPMTFTNLNKEALEERNLGQDIPFLLQWTPSVVATSDAGAGIGYTGLRIRGSDPTRTNVTINGIPLNDSESQGVFWVDMPDFVSTTESVQIQRGVGTSTNGAGAFGASIDLQTLTLKEDAYGEITNAFGSYNTRKHTFKAGSGLINDHWSFDARLSLIKSDGYIDRASSDLRSYFLSGGYYSDRTIVRGLMFSGKEITYQAWFGTPESRYRNDQDGMQTHAANNGFSDDQLANLLNSGRTYNFYEYENQVDDYKQDHYQLHLSHQFSSSTIFNAALHYTKGKGFFEQFRQQDDFSDYGLDNIVVNTDTISSGDFIRQRWLDNDFYGLVFDLNIEKGKWDITLGGAANQYNGDHFGEIIWAEYAANHQIRHRYYDNTGEKTDANVFAKAIYTLNTQLSLFGDLQYRFVDYKVEGIDNDLRSINVASDFSFFNPKVGLNYLFNSRNSVYASFSAGNREPVRNDFIDAINNKIPTHETLRDVEVGYRLSKEKFSLEANYYFMHYKNQLVLTGALNDVGTPVRTNADNSYRTGLELQWGLEINEKLRWDANATFSQNKISEFEEVLFDYTSGADMVTIQHSDTDIAFSPNIIAGSRITFEPVKNLKLGWYTKFVGEQFLDNTSNENRKLDSFLVNDALLSYSFSTHHLKHVGLNLVVNNVFNELYAANGYTFSYIFGEQITENFFYPQAETNFMLGLTLKF